MTKSLKVSTDIGGTFTDIAVTDEAGNLHVFKTPTTKGNYGQGVINAIEIAAKFQDKTVHEFLQKTSAENGKFAHGSTITTNAILEDKVGKVGLIVTRGHKDILTFRSGGERQNPYDWNMDYPKPYIPRYLTVEVTERINAEGDVVVPLNETDVIKAVDFFKKAKVEAIAICLLWDIVNPIHEKEIARIIRKEWEDVPIVLASEVNSSIRETGRTSSASINASLLPIVGDYYKELNDKLIENGFTDNVTLFNSTGGVMTVDEMLTKPIYSIDCGPALAPVSALEYARLEKGKEDLIVVDMGGTSFDISTVINGEIPVSRNAKIKHFELGIPKVDIKSIGSGGGSIAWVDSGGMLRVGPSSAGAIPGPACYEEGGIFPTVTDANLVLGNLNKEFYAGGSMRLNQDLAEKAIMEHVAKPLGLSLEEAAFSIWHTVNSDMAAGIEEVTIWQGIDPRDFLFIAGGGAAGLHIAQICKQLNVKEALVPKNAGALSSVGGLFADVKGERSVNAYTNTENFDYEVVNQSLEELRNWGIEFLDRANIPRDKQKLEFYCEARYPHQNWEIFIPLNKSHFENPADIKEMISQFHQEHLRIFAVNEESDIECINWQVRATGMIDKPVHIQKSETIHSKSSYFMGTRNVYLGPKIGHVSANIYRGSLMPVGSVIQFDEVAIIEEATMTLLCPPGCQVTITPYGNFSIKF
ncbi:hydantoinase/oxoprolinase family protein [Bacillus sp. FJAT-29937]|uniref:hydantoinase/oxoprolinase family protein n=1 Tax=Bacillus sp. FJAT-29937 TaxID=1720553 RepID=UPI000833290D|nr:hydantoinase/oxoprolinase family protein [Bacillus sp. FJAT-29937]